MAADDLVQMLLVLADVMMKVAGGQGEQWFLNCSWSNCGSRQ